MNEKYTLFFIVLLMSFISVKTVLSQTVLINHAFNTTTLPTGITSNGTISPTKAADGVCSQGMIQVNSGGFLQVVVPSCGVIRAHMKSTSSSARNVAIKYQKDGETSFTTLTPNISVLSAAIFNLSTQFTALVTNAPITIRIEPLNGNIQIHDLYVEASATLSSSADITAFTINNQIGSTTINAAAATVQINVPIGTNLTNIIPTGIAISPQSTISPSVTSALDFTNPVTYTVTAQNGSTKQWTVTVTPTASIEKEILNFRLSNAQIGNAIINSVSGTITVNVPNGTNVSNVVPQQLVVSNGATVSPLPTVAQNFSSAVVYTITAQNNSTNQFTVTINFIDPLTVITHYEAENATFTGSVNNNNTGFNGLGFVNFLDSGENEIVFTVCQQQAGVYNASFRYSLGNDTYRKGKLFINDVYHSLLNFNRTTNFTTWADEVVSINLAAGVNNIKLTWDTTDGPNIDRLSLNGLPCNTYTLQVNAVNGGSVVASPTRVNNTYFENEVVNLQSQSTPNKVFANWSGDVTGTTNPLAITMNANKVVNANFNTIPTYKLTTNIIGLGTIILQPSGGEYAENTVVTVTAIPIAGSTFGGFGGAITGNTISQTVVMNANKNVTATFNSNNNINFENVVGFAAMSGDGFTGPTRGGQCSSDTVFINGPSEFNKLCELLYNRQRAYSNNVTSNGVKKAPLVILLREGVYDGTQSLSTNGLKVFGNSMLDIPEQGDLSFVGEQNVVFKIGINVKRSYNILIRNITFFDYYDDGINIGGTETHHIWVDHCTVGHPTSRPADSEHPDGGIDVKDGASYVTISWCLIRNSWKTSLVGHSDNNGATDNNRLKVTYYNNHFFNTNSRNPRVRFGEVHVLNNLFESVQLYGAVAANSAFVFCENNFFLNTIWPMYADRTAADFKTIYGNNTDNTFTSKTGNYPARGLKHSGNDYDDSGLPIITAQINANMLNPSRRSIKFDELNANTVFTPSTYYNYTPLNATDVRNLVPVLAGADKVSFANCAALPLQFLSFNALQTVDGHLLEWITTNEVNTSHFIIEKSNDGIDFTAIKTVTAKNNSGNHIYRVTNTVFTNTVYYRVKQVDIDGKFNYSKVLILATNTKEILQVFPNPATTFITIKYPTATANTMISIVDAVGKKIQDIAVAPYSTKTFISVNSLPTGTYRIRLVTPANISTSTFIKQ